MKKLISKIFLGLIVLVLLASVTLVVLNKTDEKLSLYDNDYYNISKVGYDAVYLGTVERNIPQATYNEGFSSVGYPVYGTIFTEVSGSGNEALRQQIINEASYLTATTTANAGGGGYNRIDKDGYLYLDNEPVYNSNNVHRKLYKHTAAVGMYLGDVSDEEKGVVKQMWFAPRDYIRGYNITGLYAPAGEVIEVKLSKEVMEKTGGITIHIGQALYNGQCNNIWSTRDLNRMPVILNTLEINEKTSVYDETAQTYTGYIGSFLGGPIYIRNESVEFDVTISNAVNYCHFILGYTTLEEFNTLKKSSAPYFDLEVWDNGVLHSGSKKYASKFSYDDLYKSAVLWDKISNVSTQIATQGIVFLYDPFVAAGSAVAFPGRGSVNCPLNWMDGSLNYESFLEVGSWGNIHEYNHNFQGFGLGDGGEVTNNALSLVSYSQYTKISQNRMLGDVNENLSGWNRYTSPTWALSEITDFKYSNGKLGLSSYATLLHSFGGEKFIEIAKNSSGEGIDKWFKAVSNITSYDMTYFYHDLMGLDVSDEVLTEEKNKNNPMFVPVASIYQTGRSYLENGENKFFESAQPYKIAYNQDFMIDLSPYTFDSNNTYLSGSVVLPEGFSYKIKSVSQPENGIIKQLSDYTYIFTPNAKLKSGKIYVELEITKDDKCFDVENVTLVLEFVQTNDFDKNIIQRTTYTYDEKIYSSAVEAFENGYSGYSNCEVSINDNTFSNGRVVQDCNSEVWLETVNEKQIIEICGKYKVDVNSKYRISLRGRWNTALYVSLDGGLTYLNAAEYSSNTTSSPDFPNTDGTYLDIEITNQEWLYFKAVMICENKGRTSFIGVGLGKFDSDGNVVVSKVNSYNPSYVDLEEEFISEYLFEKKYKYNYNNTSTYTASEVTQFDNYTPWSASDHIKENLIDGDFNTYIHTRNLISSDNPFVFSLDLGKTNKVNRVKLYTQQRSDPHYPKDFILYGSNDNITYHKISEFTNTTLNKNSIICDFDSVEYRYFKFEIYTSSNKYIILSEIEFLDVFELNNGNHLCLNDESVKLYGDWSHLPSYSTFGHKFITNDGKMEFEFDGTYFAILSSIGNDIEVYIDGKKVESLLIKQSLTIHPVYLSQNLENTHHKVVVYFSGQASIDSICYW